MLRRAPLLVLLLLSPIRAGATPAVNNWYDWSARDCQNAELAAHNPLPANLTKEGVLRDLLDGPLVFTALERERVCTVVARQWKVQKAPTFVVFVETEVEKRQQNDEDDGNIVTTRKLRMGVYRQDDGGKVQLVAKSADGSAYEFRHSEEVKSLDFAAYKLTPSEYAFGVRIDQFFGGAGGSSGSQEILVLYRVEGTRIRAILNTLMWSDADNAGNWNEDGTREHTENGDQVSAELAVSKTRTRGFFDLKKRKDGKAAVFKWNGESYALHGHDPVEDVNPDGNP